MNTPQDDLTRICLLFKTNGVNYVIIGARACALHGFVRATEDIDVLIQNDKANIKSKETEREQDIWDVKVLKEILKKQIQTKE